MEENFLQPPDDDSVQVQNPEEQMPGLASYVKSKFDDSENGRRVHEQKWLQAYKNFRGIYERLKFLQLMDKLLTFFLTIKSFL